MGSWLPRPATAIATATPASPRTIPFLSPKLRKCSWAYSTVRDWGNLADQPPIRPHPRSGPASSDLRLDRRAELDRGHEPRGLVQESPGGVQQPRGRPSVGPAHPEVWRPGAAGRGAPGRGPTRRGRDYRRSHAGGGGSGGHSAGSYGPSPPQGGPWPLGPPLAFQTPGPPWLPARLSA